MSQHGKESDGGKSMDGESTQMSFKDWKKQKEIQNKGELPQPSGKSDKRKGNSNKIPPSRINFGHNDWQNRINFNEMSNPSQQMGNFFGNCNNMGWNNRQNFNGSPPFGNGMAGYQFNNGFHNNFNNGLQNNCNNFQNNCFNGFPGNFNNGPSNNFNNRQNTNDERNNPRGRGGGNQNRGYRNANMPDNFFNTDGLYVQKDMIQETLAQNPFKYNPRAKQLIRELESKKKNNGKKSTHMRNDAQSTNTTAPKSDTIKKNPTKPFVPRPKPPEAEIKGTLEERKKEWREYREAMKPFKNKEFYNAKRVVQRLGKKDPSELDEKDRDRLEKARERMSAYKQKLSEKYDHYIPAPKSQDDIPGELYVLQRGSHSHWSERKSSPDQFKNSGNFGEFNSKNTFDNGGDSNSSGRKILGGTSKYSSFVSGGVMASITQY